MPTIDQVKKLYSTLTAPERFALSFAASVRGDTSERAALLDSAPKVTIEYPHTLGISEGFNDLLSHHTIQQLGAASTFWMLLYWDYDGEGDERITSLIGADTLPIADVRTLAARRFMEGLEAFRAICQEYKIEPDALKEIAGYDQVLAMTELIIRRAFELAPEELTQLEETKTAYREVIERNRKICFEDRAK